MRCELVSRKNILVKAFLILTNDSQVTTFSAVLFIHLVSVFGLKDSMYLEWEFHAHNPMIYIHNRYELFRYDSQE